MDPQPQQSIYKSIAKGVSSVVGYSRSAMSAIFALIVLAVLFMLNRLIEETESPVSLVVYVLFATYMISRYVDKGSGYLIKGGACDLPWAMQLDTKETCALSNGLIASAYMSTVMYFYLRLISNMISQFEIRYQYGFSVWSLISSSDISAEKKNAIRNKNWKTWKMLWITLSAVYTFYAVGSEMVSMQRVTETQEQLTGNLKDIGLNDRDARIKAVDWQIGLRWI